jgi:hypothetical protein
MLASTWQVRQETFYDGWCEVTESQGVITPGTKRVVRFSVSTPVRFTPFVDLFFKTCD